MAESRKYKVNSGSYTAPDVPALLMLAQILTNVSPKVPVQMHEVNIPGESVRVRGQYTPSEDKIDLVNNRFDGDDFFNTMLHEFTHAQAHVPGMITSQKTFLDDMVQEGHIKPHDRMDMANVADKLVGKLTKDAYDLKLPSSASGKFEEVRAAATADKLGKDAGKAGDPAVAKLMEMNPEFATWINNDLGAKFIGSPRMTNIDDSVLTKLNQFIISSGIGKGIRSR